MTGNERAIEDPPANGSHPKDRCSMRLSEHARAAVQAWAKKQPDKPTLAEAIRRLVEIGVTDWSAGAIEHGRMDSMVEAVPAQYDRGAAVI